MPRGVYKPNDENPKAIDWEDEAKVPDFAELATLESWVHLNPAILAVSPP